MVEYTENDSEEIGKAISTLVLKCAEAGAYELNCIISYGENLKLDCHFGFKVHKDG